MQTNSWMKIISVVGLSLSQTLSLALLFHPLPSQAQPQPQPQTPRTSSGWDNMFSEDIQTILKACIDRGMVDIATGGDKDGSVICASGFRDSSVQFNDYLNTLSDLMAGAFVVGMRTAYINDNKLTREQKAQMLSMFVSPSGKAMIQKLLEQKLANLPLLPKNSARSPAVLASNIVERVVPVLQNQNNFENFLGTPEQQKLVKEKFCTPPGTSITEVQKLVPGFSSIQLYAVCIQGSGVADRVAR
ncbi:MAG: hypothetical protein VKL59_18670 [Nostocaceae cyanobacterium]|nr:hypothetical protein [Nostocaceae cyanobacterium]